MSSSKLRNIRMRYQQRNRLCCGLLLTITLGVATTQSVANDPTQSTIVVKIQPRTGGSIQGPVVDYNDHGLVLMQAGVPYALAWKQLESGTAYTARRDLLAHTRGGWDKLSAQDHFNLGRFALEFNRQDLARADFNQTSALAKKQYEESIHHAWQQFREKRKRWKRARKSTHADRTSELSTKKIITDDASVVHGIGDDLDRAVHIAEAGFVHDTDEDIRARVRAAYLQYGEKVQEIMGSSVVFIETEHFLIWTDWPKRSRDQLIRWLEDMYSSLSKQFGVDDSTNIFLSKCPVFCWRSKARYQRFAQKFDGYDGKDSIGYTRSIESNGHVHMAFMRRGSEPADIDRLACTIVHEGTHAFLHRLYTTRLLPHWINEGAAEMTATVVLGRQCPAGGNATLLAKQYAKYNWPLGQFLQSVAPIDAHQYPLAQSIVSYLNTQSIKRWRALIKALKNGNTFSKALAHAYDGLNVKQLESGWREANADQAGS